MIGEVVCLHLQIRTKGKTRAPLRTMYCILYNTAHDAINDIVTVLRPCTYDDILQHCI